MRKLASLCRRLRRINPSRRFVVVRYAPGKCLYRYHVMRSCDNGPYLAVLEADTVDEVYRYLLDQFLEVNQ